MSRIQINRGLKANIPTLQLGEPAFMTDTNQLYIGGSSSNVLINDVTQQWVIDYVAGLNSGAVYQKAVGISTLNYKKNSVPNNTATGIFTHNMALNGRCVVDYNLIGLYPADTGGATSVITSTRGIVVVNRSNTGTMGTNSSSTIITATSGVSSATMTLTVTLTTDTTNNKFTFLVNQNNNSSFAASVMIKAEITYAVGTTLTQQTITTL